MNCAFKILIAVCLFTALTAFAYPSFDEVHGDTVSAICKDATFKNGYGQGPYRDSMHPDQKTRLHGLKQQIQMLQYILKKNGINLDQTNVTASIEQFFDSKAKSTAVYPNGLRAEMLSRLQGISPDEVDAVKIKLLHLYGPSFCPSPQQNDCKLNYNKISQWMDPKEGGIHVSEVDGADEFSRSKQHYEIWNLFVGSQLQGWISLPELLVRLASDPAYSKGTALMATRLLQKVKLVKEQANQSVGDLYDDVLQAFIDSGANAARAKTMAIEYLAVYGTRGASTPPLYILMTQENAHVLASFAVVGSAISYLDGASLPSGKVYSLPNSIKTTCDYTRPYHFWLEAYVTWRLTNEGASPRAAFDAAHASEISYEKGARTNTKNNIAEGDLAPELHHFYNVETQKNIVFGDVGGLFGIQLAKGSILNINVDEAFMRAYSTAKLPDGREKSESFSFIKKIVEEYEETSLQKFLDWDQLMAIDANLDAFHQLLPK